MNPSPLQLNQTVGEIVREHYQTAQVFKKNRLDFCCGGKKTLQQACIDKNLEPKKLLTELEAAVATPEPIDALQYESWTASQLIEHIVATHHAFIRHLEPDLLELSAKVARVHGDKEPNLLAIHRIVQETMAELMEHLIKEEQILFPYIQSLDRAAQTGQTPPAAHFGVVQNPIRMMEHEHDFVGRQLEALRALTNDYLLPEIACNTWRVVWEMLEALENDLHLHIHLENNILFPKAIQLETHFHNR